MRVIVFPSHGYISDNLISHLKRSGHDVLPCAADTQGDDPAWSAALQQAAAVFHVLHGHEQHAKQTLLHLLQTSTAQAPVAFIGISTPLTWAATPAPAADPERQILPAQDAAALQEHNSTAQEVAGAAADQHPAQAVAAAAEAGSEEVQQVHTACLTAEDAPRRRPAAAAVDTLHAEQLVLRSNRPGRLHTHVVCPGVLYGAGEADDQLHGLWNLAWEGQQPLQVHGSGGNRLPTLHVQALAAACEGVMLQQQEQLQAAQHTPLLLQPGPTPQHGQQQQGQYHVVSDGVHVTQRQLLEAVGQLLVHGQLRDSGSSWLAPPISPMLMLDLPLACSSGLQPYRRCCPHGLLGHLHQVLQEYVSARSLSPLRILIRGPPASGKTHIGLRLAQLYGLLHINTAIILAELQHMDAETQKVADTQLGGREGRLSPQLMARLAQHLLARHPAAAKQGWVLEGWPRSLSAAVLFTSVVAGGGGASSSSSGGGSEASGKEKGMRRDSTAGAGVKGARRSTAPSGGGAAASGAGARARRSVEGEELAAAGEGLALQSPDLLPHFVIDLDVGEEELQRRVKALAAAEAAAAAVVAAEATAAKAPAGTTSGKRPAGGRSSIAGAAPPAVAPAGVAPAPAGPFTAAHNNLKDWGRRMEAYRLLLQEDAVDLAAKKAAVVAAYQAQQAAAAAAADAASDQALASGREGGRQAGDKQGGSRTVTPRIRQPAAGEQALPPDVKLPEHGGFVAYFVDAGAKYIKVSNPMDSTVAAAAASLAPSRAATPRQPMGSDPAPPPAVVPLGRLEQQLAADIGPPHNYIGFPTSFLAAAAAVGGMFPVAAQEGGDQSMPAAAAGLSGEASVRLGTGGLPNSSTASATAAAAAAAVSQGSGMVAAGSLLPELSQLLAAAEALAAEGAVRASAQVSEACRPLVSALSESLLSDLMAGLVQVALTRPQDPCQVIADHLLAAAARQNASYQDPYDDPTYAIQLAKVEAKAAREAARAAAAAAKAAREQAAAAEAGSKLATPSDTAQPGAAAAAAATADPADTNQNGSNGSSGAPVISSKREPSGPAAAKPGSKQGGRAAGARASVAHQGGAQPLR